MLLVKIHVAGDGEPFQEVGNGDQDAGAFVPAVCFRPYAAAVTGQVGEAPGFRYQLEVHRVLRTGEVLAGVIVLRKLDIEDLTGFQPVQTTVEHQGITADFNLLADLHLLDTAPDASLPPFLSGILANLSVFFGSSRRVDLGRVFWGLAVCAALLALGYVWLKRAEPRRNGALAALLLGALVLARFALLGNHSYLHEFFTYRALCATVMAVLTAFVLNIRLPQKEVGP